VNALKEVPEGLSLNVTVNQQKYVTYVQLLVTLEDSFVDNNSSFNAKLLNEVGGGENTLVAIHFAKDAVVKEWSEWSVCSISCSPKKGIYGNAGYFVILFKLLSNLVICKKFMYEKFICENFRTSRFC
jgi:hypothetical protein